MIDAPTPINPGRVCTLCGWRTPGDTDPDVMALRAVSHVAEHHPEQFTDALGIDAAEAVLAYRAGLQERLEMAPTS